MFVWHIFANLTCTKNKEEIVKLLGSALLDSEPSPVLNDQKDIDYSDWDAFCDVPIINNKSLNKIRVKCHSLTRDSDRHFKYKDDSLNTMYITQEGKAEVQKLLDELLSND